jgi:hypothetical protein
MDSYVTKPIRRDLLRDAILRVVTRREVDRDPKGTVVATDVPEAARPALAT